jgi:hypothetical protein
MKWIQAVLLVWIITMGHSYAQYTRFSIALKDKKGTNHQLDKPGTYLSERAIARRTRYKIPLDSTDLPGSMRC